MSTLTVYPNPGVTTDGPVLRSATEADWSVLIAGAGTAAWPDTDADRVIQMAGGATTNKFTLNGKSIFLFDASALTSSAIISAAVMSIYGDTKADILAATPNVDIYTSTPASDTTLVAADYSQVGSTSQTGSPITYANWTASAYNDFTFDATGRSNISKTGISKFAARNANYDVTGTPPAWAEGTSRLNGYFSDAIGTTNDPKLVITYTLPVNTGFFMLM